MAHDVMRAGAKRARLTPAILLALLALAGPARAEVLGLVTPNGGESWEVGSRRQILWTGAAPGQNVRIDLSRDGGLSFETLFSNTPNSGVKDWEVEGPASSTCRLRIARLDDPTASAVSAADFTIAESIPGVTVLHPNGGDIWIVGTQQAITWSAHNGGNVQIEISRDGGGLYETLFDRTENDGVELWTVTEPLSPRCRIRITLAEDPQLTDDSDTDFFITHTRGLTVRAPNGGEVWTVGTRQLIRWDGLEGGRVSIELSRDGGRSWERLFASTPNDGTQPWVVVGANARLALIRITRLSPPLVGDMSDRPFEITARLLTVITPRALENWVVGTQRLIQWAGRGVGEVAIDLSRDGGTTWETIEAGTPNDNAQFATVSQPTTSQAVVRIRTLDGLAEALSGGFTISTSSLAVALPNGGEEWATGSEQVISWVTTTAGSVHVELTRDGGGTWETLFENTPNDGSEPWTVTNPPCFACQLRVSSWQQPELVDVSDTWFTIFCAPDVRGIGAGQESADTLRGTDCEAPHHPGKRGRFYTFGMPESGLVTIDLRSSVFDPYLILLGADGDVIAENDNAEPGTDARLDSIELPAGGPYTIEVTSAGDNEVGAYRITLTRFDITLLNPRGGETWKFGESRLISWRSGAPGVPVDITVLRQGDAQSASVPIAIGTANDGIEAWVVRPPASSLAVIQACIPYGSRGTQVCDLSAPLSLVPCARGEARPCYSGPASTLRVGVCQGGAQQCEDGIFGSCQGEVLPQAETCGDGIDQDCNGADLPCAPCPQDGRCDDEDACSADACIEGQCRNALPPPWELFACRAAALTQALDTPPACASEYPPRIREQLARKLTRILGLAETLIGKARAARTQRECVDRVRRARRKSERLTRRLTATVSRGAMCDADAGLLARRINEVAAAIVAVGSCPREP